MSADIYVPACINKNNIKTADYNEIKLFILDCVAGIQFLGGPKKLNTMVFY